METIRERRLRLWKARQEAEGYDVSKVKTLEEAEHFFDKKRKKKGNPSSDTAGAVPPSPQGEGLEAPNALDEVPGTADEVPGLPAEEVIEDEQCDIDPVDEPV